MINPKFLTVPAVLEIHKYMVEAHGGDAGVRDMNLLESAVMGPQSSFCGEYLHQGIPDMASAYLYGICKNHALVDGNKRTSLVCAELFVSRNNHILKASNNDMLELTAGVAEGRVSQDDATDFLKKSIAPKLEIDKPKVLVDDSACGETGFIVGDKIIPSKMR